MPNPLIKGGPANTSRREQTDRTPLEPIPEAYEGTNLPYRGVQYHGVEPNALPQPPQGFSGAIEVDYEDAVPEQEAVPVRVVNRSDRYFRTARADTMTLLPATATLVVGRDDTRTSLKIVNTHDTELVYVGFTQGMVSWNGSYPLAPGKDVSLTTKDDVFVWTETAADVVVGWLSENELPIDD